MTTLLLIHAASTLAMTGVIWFVQLVHYPLFQFVAIERFPTFASHYQRRTAWLVAPLMLAEAATATLLFVPGVTPSQVLATAGLLLIVGIWVATALVQVPLHRRLSRGFDGHVARRLVRSNWLRTLAWSARSLVALELLAL